MLRSFIVVAVLVLFSLSMFAQASDIPFYKVKYDPKADPHVELQKAVAVAREAGKNILLDVGGEWCIWCHRLDSFFETNDDVSEFLLANYVPLKINMSKENQNKEFLSKFPVIEGYPHLFALDSNGKLLHSQETGSLEEGKGHGHDKVFAFLKKWAPTKHAN
jgi:thiol:disulfide interchange protein